MGYTINEGSTIQSRNKYFDFVRGLAIIMVLYIHTCRLDGAMALLLRQFCNAGVPIFIALSAFFLSKKELTSNIDKYRFWNMHIVKVYVPCVIWSLPFLINNMMTGGGIIKVIQMLVCGYGVFYFIALIIQFYLLLPFLQPFTKSLLLLSVVVTAITIIFITYITVILGIQLPLLLRYGFFFVWIFFFVLGGRIRKIPRNYSLKMPLLICVVGIIISYAESKLLLHYSIEIVGYKLSAFIYSAGAILLLFSERIESLYKADNIFCRIVEFIGKASFGIYLIHLIIIRSLPFNSGFLLFVSTLSVTIVVIEILRMVLPPMIQTYIGIR